MNGGKEEARQAGRGEEEENEGMVWWWRKLARGRRDEQLSVRESPPFLQRGLLLALLVFHKKQNRNQLRPEEK